MKHDDNLRLVRVGPQTPCGALMRRYWHPVALVDEFETFIDPARAERPVKPVQVLGEHFVLFRNASGEYGLLERHCPHRGADLAFGRLESAATSRWGAPSEGLRCPFHGWKFGVDGRCLDTPAEPLGSTLCDRVAARRLPLRVVNGVIFAWLGEPGTEPALPALDFLNAPASHTFAFKGLWRCNWLQAQEVGLDPAHTSFLHAFFEDEDLSASYGRQFRAASAGTVNGEAWPMTRIMREFHRPEIRSEPSPWGLQITTLRQIDEALTHVRITHDLFPNGFVIPLSPSLTITQFHVPIDDVNTWWYSLFTSFDAPVDRHTMLQQRLAGNPAPDFAPLKGAHNAWGYDPAEQASHTLLGMGEHDINVHDQWACESMGAISDRTREHLGTTDKVIMAHRRLLAQAITDVEAGREAPGFAVTQRSQAMLGPDTIDGIAPSDTWPQWWREQVARKRAAAPWSRSAEFSGS
jgi:phthalate 4,5-dioxygenase